MAKHPEIQSDSELDNRLKVVLEEESGTQLEVERTVEAQPDGYSVTLTPPRSFHPGVYRLEALLEAARGASRALQHFYRQITGAKDDGDLTLLSTDVHWGDVALNADAAAYHPGDQAAIHVAVLDDDDTPKCNPDLTLTVTDPSGNEHAYTPGHGIDVSACPLAGTGSAENAVKLTLPEAGTYQLALAYPGLGTGQTVVRSTLDVSDDQPLLRVTRASATQTAPGRIETMTLTVTAAQTFNGEVDDTVPDGFTVVQVGDVGTSEQTGDATTVSWDREFPAGQPVTLSYLFRVDDDVPVFGLFGPLTAKGTVDRNAVVPPAVSSSSLSSESSVSSESPASSAESSHSANASASSASSADGSPGSSSVSSGASTSSGSSVSAVSSAEATPSSSSASPASSAQQSADSQGGTVSSASASASSDSTSSDSSSPPLSWLFNWFAPLANGQEDNGQVSFSDEHQWQVLATQPPQTAPAPGKRVNRKLLLERKRAAFTASESPSFKLVDAHFDTGAVLDGSGHLKTEVAVRELLHAVISDKDVQQSLVQEVVREKAQTIADGVAGKTDASADQVAQALATTGSAQQAVAQALTDKKTVQTAVSAIDTATTEDKIVDALVAQTPDPSRAGAGSGAVEQVIQQAVSEEKPRVKQQLDDAVTQAVTTSSATAQTVAAAAESGAAAPGSANASAGSDASRSPFLHLTLKGPHGEVIENPRFHFEVGSVVLALDPSPSFTPGLYTLEFTVTNPLTGEQETQTQQFVWGVLAMNPDQDHYQPGETAHLAFGVLDDQGAVVCDAGLTLQVAGPAGDVRTLSTADKSISTTGTCGKKQAGFIGPDYEAYLPLPQAGGYRLTLTATTKNGTRSIAMTLMAESQSDVTVTRSAATRLWPFAPSPMDITVEFGTDVTGRVTDTVPPGFVVSDIQPDGTTEKLADGTTLIHWQGSWPSGMHAKFHYLYDAPDISPHFFLIGPLTIDGSRDQGS